MPSKFDELRDRARRSVETARRRRDDPEGFYADRMEESLAWSPESNSDYRAVAATEAASTGDLFDPTQDPRTRYDAIANGGNNLANYNNRTQQVLNRGMNDYEARDAAAADSRARADEYATAPRPTYQIPTYSAPMPFEFGGQRAPMQTDADIASRYGDYASLLGVDNTEGIDYEAERVGDYGQAFNKWLTGAQSSFGKRLQEESNRLTESAAARNRLNTGFFEEDQGELQRMIAGDFSDAAQMAALDAAGLSLRGAEGNADRALEAARLRADRSDVAYGNRVDLLDRSLDRSAYIDKMGDDRFESDRDFGYDVYGHARDFGRDTYEDDRNFGYGAFRDQTRDFENDRDFFEDRYRFDEDQADDARNFYADWLTGAYDRRTDMTRYQDAQPKWWEQALGVALPVAGTVFGGPGGGAAAAGAGAGGGPKSAAANPEGLPVSYASPDEDEDEGTSWYLDYLRRGG